MKWTQNIIKTTRGDFEVFTKGEGHPLCVTHHYSEFHETGDSFDISVDGAFLAVGLVPENGIFAHLAKLDDRGYFAANESCTAETEGVFVAGDCRNKNIRQVVTAAADGAIAAMAACRYLDR